MLLLAIVIFLTITLVIFIFGAALYAPSSVIGSRLRALGWQKEQRPERTPIKERLEQALDPLSKALPLSADEVSRARGWLIQAGYREPQHVTIYVGTRLLLAFLGFVTAMAIWQFRSLPLLVSFAALGFFIPRFALKRMISKRQRRIELGLPDALDLTVICVEAGLSLDQSLMRVGSELSYAHPELSAELHLVNLEMRAGKPRTEALHNLTARTGVDDIKALVTTLIQTDRFGTSVAQALRVHSDSLRTERRQRAEEAAAKTTIKMVVPLALFILPSILVVTIGPALIQLYRTLVPNAGR